MYKHVPITKGHVSSTENNGSSNDQLIQLCTRKIVVLIVDQSLNQGTRGFVIGFIRTIFCYSSATFITLAKNLRRESEREATTLLLCVAQLVPHPLVQVLCRCLEVRHECYAFVFRELCRPSALVSVEVRALLGNSSAQGKRDACENVAKITPVSGLWKFEVAKVTGK
jgi:hypothetical protein